jgi:predicted nuclease with TOPRIM domain
MDNQHRLIKGYKELSPEQIDLMNKIKEKGAEVGALVDELKDLRVNSALDQRWVSIGATHLQEGFMALTRSVAKPDFF